MFLCLHRMRAHPLNCAFSLLQAAAYVSPRFGAPLNKPRLKKHNHLYKRFCILFVTFFTARLWALVANFCWLKVTLHSNETASKIIREPSIRAFCRLFKSCLYKLSSLCDSQAAACVNRGLFSSNKRP